MERGNGNLENVPWEIWSRHNFDDACKWQERRESKRIRFPFKRATNPVSNEEMARFIANFAPWFRELIVDTTPLRVFASGEICRPNLYSDDTVFVLSVGELMETYGARDARSDVSYKAYELIGLQLRLRESSLMLLPDFPGDQHLQVSPNIEPFEIVTGESYHTKTNSNGVYKNILLKFNTVAIYGQFAGGGRPIFDEVAAMRRALNLQRGY